MSAKGNSVTDTSPTAAQEWKQNWPLVLASSMGFCFFSIMLSTTAMNSAAIVGPTMNPLSPNSSSPASVEIKTGQKSVLDYLINGRICREDPRMFQDLYHILLFGDGCDFADPYFVLLDLKAYIEAQERIRTAYMDTRHWNAMAIRNIAHAGIFSSDRTAQEYNQLIWRL